MAVTRINNNQITDAVSGNTQFGINANTKIQPNSITSTLLANNLTYGSDLTITGNLSIQGNVTAIDTTNVTIEDPLLLLASQQTGAPTLDIGFIGQRGTSNNVASVWDESSQAFVVAYTDSGAGDNTTINILSYADFITGNANVTGTLTAANISFTGNVAGNLSVTGTLFAGNVSTIGYVSALGNVTGGNVIAIETIYGANLSLSGNVISPLNVTGNVTSGNVFSVGNVSAVGNLIGAAVNAANLSLSGNVISDLNVPGNVYSGNIYSNAVTGNTIYSNSITPTNILFAGTTVANGTPIIGNPDLTFAVEIGTQYAYALTANNTSGYFGGNVSAGGNVLATGYVSATGNATSGNVLTGGFVSAFGNITTSGYYLGDGGFISNINAANVATTKIVNGGSYANVTAVDGPVVIASGTSSNIVATFYDTGANLNGQLSVTGGISASQEISALGNILTSGNFSATGNIIGGQISATGNISATGEIYGSRLSVTGNVIGLGLFATSFISSVGNITANDAVNTANLSLSGNVLSALNVTGNVAGQNFATAGIISATGTATVGNVATGGNVSATGSITGGNVYTAGDASATGNVFGGNVFAQTDVSAGGNVNVTGNVNANTLSGASVGIWSSSGGLDIHLGANGNVNLNTTYINNLQTPQQAFDAATKEYVDSIASGLDLKASVEVATVQPLDAEAEVTLVAYNNGTSGVGATLTITTTSQLLIDGVNLSTLAINDRVLIKNELDPASGNSDAAWNGIYVLTSTGALQTVLTRSTDFDNEGTLGSIPGSFTFVIGGGGQAGTGWVCITQNPITMGTTPILWTQFSGGGTYSAGNAIAINGTVISALFDNSTVGINGSNQLYIPANAPLTTPNIGDATGSSLSVTGSITGNVINGASMSITGNVIAGNVTTTNLSLSGNVLGNVNVDNNLTANGLFATTVISTAGNVYGGNVSSAKIYDTSIGSQQLVFGNVDASGLLSSASTLVADGTNLSAAGNINAGTRVTAAQITDTAIGAGQIVFGDGTANGQLNGSSTFTTDGNNVTTGGNVSAGGFISATGNIIAANFTTTGSTGNITGANVIAATTLTATGNVYAGTYFIGDGGLISNINAANVSSTKISNGGTYANIATPDGNLVIAIGAGSNVVATYYDNGVNFSTISVTGNVAGGNILTAGEVSATGNATAGNILTAGAVSATGSATAGNILTAGFVSATGNATAGNILTAGAISATGNVNGANVIGSFLYGDGSNITGLSTSAANIANGTSNVEIYTANGNVTFGVNGFGNVFTVSEFGVSTTGNVNAAINVTSPNVVTNVLTTTNTNLSIGNLANANVAIDGLSANLVFVSGSTNTVSIGSNLVTVGATLAVNAVDSFLLPVGNTVQRPGSPVAGMMRYNTSLATIEAYDGVQWEAVGSPTFTVIQNEQFNGDGSTVTFTLGSSQTTDSCLVTINGVVQIPTTAYSVSGTYPTCVLTFTEAPQVSDVIDVREITTTATVTSISNSSGNAVITTSATAANVDVTGNLVVSNGNGFIYGDGTYLTNVGGGNVVATRIQSGTTQANIAGANGNFYVAVAGSNVLNITSTQATFTGNLNPSGNATQSLGNATNQWSNLWISGNTIFIGGANLAANGSTISYNGSNLVAATGSGNIDTAGTISATGNVVGSSLIATNIMSATGNVTGGNIRTAGQVVATGNITGGNLSVSTGTITVGNIVNGNGNGVGNIGSSSNYFNTIFATATTALYADLAEKYVGDAEYTPGTVVSFGGEFEVTASTTDADRRVAGVVSTNPSYIMNGGLDGANVVTVALTGRVPCRVTGTVRKGDMMVSNGDGTARAEADPKAGAIIGKALADFDGETGVIEVVIGVK